jgi:hypothetical protein
MLRSKIQQCRLFGWIILLPLVTVVACGQPSASNKATQRTTSVATPTFLPSGTATPAPPAGTGWKPVDFPHGDGNVNTIAFSPSVPATAYTCANSGGTRGPLALGTSHDGGHTWQFHPTAIPDTACQIAVSSIDPQLVALQADWYLCILDGCTTQAEDVYISHDGGQDWKLMPPPDGLPNFGAGFYDSDMVWIGSTLFIAAQLSVTPSNSKGTVKNLIAASVNGAPFVSVGQGFVDSLPSTSLPSFYPAGSTLYIHLPGAQSANDPLAVTYVKTDAYATTVTPVTFRYQGQQVYLLAGGHSSNLLFGQLVTLNAAKTQYQIGIILSSKDGGATWNPLAPFPSALYCCNVDYLFVAPDGLILAETQTHVPDQIYVTTGVFVLDPGTSRWRYVSSPPAGTGILAVSVDGNGDPITLWTVALPGLKFHTLS